MHLFNWTPRRRILAANLVAQELFGQGTARLTDRRLSEVLFHDCEIFEIVDQVFASGGDYIANAITLSGPSVRPVTVSARFGYEASSQCLNMVLLPVPRTVATDTSGLSAFASILGHEIKNPLGGISGAAQLLLREANGSQSDLLALIKSEAERISRLVDRFARFEMYSAPRFSAVNVHEILNDIISMSQVSEPDTTYLRSFDPSLPDVTADRDHLHEALLNLIKNASEAVAGLKDGEVRISSAFQPGIRMVEPGHHRKGSGALLIRIQDNGAGISDADRDRILVPFYTTKTGGSGIGLAMANDIALAHGGALSFESAPGRTVFELLLPIRSNRRS